CGLGGGSSAADPPSTGTVGHTNNSVVPSDPSVSTGTAAASGRTTSGGGLGSTGAAAATGGASLPNANASVNVTDKTVDVQTGEGFFVGYRPLQVNVKALGTSPPFSVGPDLTCISLLDACFKFLGTARSDFPGVAAGVLLVIPNVPLGADE